MRRVNVVGTSCSGKTTLARALVRRLGLPHVELDALFWRDRPDLAVVRLRSPRETLDWLKSLAA